MGFFRNLATWAYPPEIHLFEGIDFCADTSGSAKCYVDIPTGCKVIALRNCRYYYQAIPDTILDVPDKAAWLGVNGFQSGHFMFGDKTNCAVGEYKPVWT